MNVTDWQKRLEDTFGSGTVVGPSLLPIIASETQFGMSVANDLHGYAVLSRSFQSFYADTLRAVEVCGGVPSAKSYWPLVFLHIATFRLFRSSEILLRNGHPLAGYSLLRDVKDRAFAIASVARGIATLTEIFGVDGQTPSTTGYGQKEYEQTILARKKIDGKILKETIGTTSGFSQSMQAVLRRWNQLFHAEVHGSYLSLAVDLTAWYKNPGPLPMVHPSGLSTPIGMHVNRFEETAWLILRILPFLQPQAGCFGDDWVDKWHILDSSFRVLMQAHTPPTKELADALVLVIDKKFPFSPTNLAYYE